MSTILLADDDQLLRLILRERLERAGHEVLECGDGFAAIEIAMEERPEFLILDVMMPLARGLEVVREVRRQDGWHPGIVMVSARTRVTDRLNALEAGADIYLEKPVAPNALVEAIDRLSIDQAPTRIVDILGPVWATLAMDRLLRRAEFGRFAERAAALQELFSRQMLAVLGRETPQLPTGPAVLRVLWEHSLRELIGDAGTPIVPASADVVVPDVAAITRWLSADALERPQGAQVATWASVLGRVLAGHRSPTDAAVAGVEAQFTNALRHVLGIDRTIETATAASLRTILGHGDGAAADGGRLQQAFSARLGAILGMRSIESDIWSQALAQALGRTGPQWTAAGPHPVHHHIAAALEDALRGPSGDPTLPRPTGELWTGVLDSILAPRATYSPEPSGSESVDPNPPTPRAGVSQ